MKSSRILLAARVGWRTSVSNRGDFRALVEDWAKASVKGLDELKALSPIAP